MKPDIRMIAVDLDGTLLTPDKRVSKRNRGALLAAAEKGIEIVIASGRSYSSLPQDALHIPCIRYAITSNGSSIFSLPEGNRIYAKDIPEEKVRQLLAVARRYDFPLEVIINGVSYAASGYCWRASDHGLPETSNNYIRSTRVPIEDPLSFAFEQAAQIEGFNFIVSDPALREEIGRDIRKIGGLYLVSSAPYYMEIAEESVSKAAACDYLAVLSGMSAENVLAFGDSPNDIELLSYAGTGIAMGNADPSVTDAADGTTGTNGQDGIAAYLEANIL